MRSKDLEAFDLSRETADTRAAYGTDRFSQGVLLARRLVERGVRFVEVEYGGFDWHTDNFEQMEEKIPVLDQALSALLADLSANGLLEETLVVVATEFGRSPVIASNSGRNHFPKAFSALMAGGGVKVVKPTAKPTRPLPTSLRTRSGLRFQRKHRLRARPAL